MKDGTKVKVVSCRTGHDFRIGEIVTRKSSEYDYESKDSLGFVGDYGDVWYMCPDEYVIADRPEITRVQQLEEMLQWYVDNDEVDEFDPANEFWTIGKHKAIKLLENK